MIHLRGPRRVRGRKLTAFGACTIDRTIVEDTSVHRLRDRIDAVQRAVAAGAPIRH
jgi:hypothetical protein